MERGFPITEAAICTVLMKFSIKLFDRKFAPANLLLQMTIENTEGKAIIPANIFNLFCIFKIKQFF